LSSRAVAAFFGFVSVVVFAGCYGSTEPATDVGPDSATLNGRGVANNGPVTVHFEYWLSDGSGSTQQTDALHFPGGSQGPFSQKVTGLAETSAYSFRMCGSDDGGGATVCAQTRTFQTHPPPTEDSVTGDVNVPPVAQGTIDAHSGPSGENPRGHVHYQGSFDKWQEFDGDVTCVAVNGHRGAVGAVGQAIPLTGPTDPQPATVLATVVDSDGNGSDTIFGVFADGSTPPDCATASFDTQFSNFAELVVTDAAAITPTSAR
jgi:hypothetical protein